MTVRARSIRREDSAPSLSSACPATTTMGVESATPPTVASAAFGLSGIKSFSVSCNAWSTSYLHGRSDCVNPLLLCAMGDGADVLAFDVFFDREGTDGLVLFLTVPDAVARLGDLVEADPGEAEAKHEGGRCHVSTAYLWDDGATRYERLAQELSAGAGRRGLV